MVTTQRKLRRQAMVLAIAATAFTSFGVAVVAAPFTWAPRATLDGKADAQDAKLAPLAAGASIQLASAGGQEREDCVRVTKMTGPDGKVYPTFGMVCGGAE